MYRVYVEDFNPPIWAVDDGDSKNQRRFEQVVWYAVGCTKYDLTADNVKDPKCWLEFPDAELRIINNTAVLR